MVVVVGAGVKTPNSSQFFLSEELIIEILTRSDAKTLFRCKSVSKTWKTIISDQSFINRFISRSTTLPPSITGFFCRLGNISDPNSSHYFLHTTTSNALPLVDQTLTFLTSIHGPVTILDSSNGLLLCAKKPITFPWNQIACYVCNPITKKYVTLPPSQYWNPMGGALLNSYNVNVDVNNFYAQNTHFMVYSFVKTIPHMIQVEIFNSKTGSWKPPKSYHHVWHSRNFICLTFYNGSVYWIQENGRVVVCDLDQTIRPIEIPREDNISPRLTEKWTLHLGTSAGSLYFVERSRTSFFIWVLVDGVTFHLNHVIEIESLKKPVVGYEPELRPRYKFLGFHPFEYKVVLVGVNPNEAALYCVDKMRTEHINDFQPGVFCNSALRVIPYSLPAWPTCIPCIGNS